MTHKLKLAIDGDTVTPTFTCAEPTGAPCRLTCATCHGDGCEDDNGHPTECTDLTDAGRCLAIEWITYVDWLECHDDVTEPLRSGFILVRWDGNGWVWRNAPNQYDRIHHIGPCKVLAAIHNDDGRHDLRFTLPLHDDPTEQAFADLVNGGRADVYATFLIAQKRTPTG